MSETNTLLSRISGVWAREKESAKATYSRLLKRAELDGKELSDRETAELAKAMQDAGITLAQAEQHRELCQKILVDRPIAEGLPQAESVEEKAKAAMDKVAGQIAELQKSYVTLFSAHDASKFEVSRAQSAARRLELCTVRLADEIGVTA